MAPQGLTQDADDYDAKAAHVELAKKMKKRDPATAPAVGDRVPYVIIKARPAAGGGGGATNATASSKAVGARGVCLRRFLLHDTTPPPHAQAAKGAKAYEKAEDPIYALKNNLPIDCQHYLEHHLAQPLLRLFEPLMKNPRELLSGAHTRSILVSTPSAASGGIMRFAQKRLTCLGCKAPLGKSETTVCKHCRVQVRVGGCAHAGVGGGKGGAIELACTPVHTHAAAALQEGDIYQRTVLGVNDLEAQFSSLWTQCQRCQGSLHQDVLCRSRDCPIFYRRMKARAHTAVEQRMRAGWRLILPFGRPPPPPHAVAGAKGAERGPGDAGTVRGLVIVGAAPEPKSTTFKLLSSLHCSSRHRQHTYATCPKIDQCNRRGGGGEGAGGAACVCA